ncbi:MAG TPA: nickel pincer cofactor biosynthesis protein LarC [Chitinispirillaceae bacterium]|nr:nickel pincer cofactor biosynthesis protein LarC [Chitinispirillaceae bacterium]
MQHVFFDLLSGASGDMLLASLFDIGFPVEYCTERLESLNIESIRIDIKKVERNGIHCTFIDPVSEPSHHYRHYTDIMTILRSGKLEKRIVQCAEKVFTHLAQAEAQVHNIPLEKVHFHEIGAVDTIIDIVGFCAALEYFKIDTVFYSTLTDGFGTMKAAHGIMPIPVPAVAMIIQGKRFRSLPVESELLTPTGAAILTALGTQVQTTPEGIISRIGYGCGAKVFEHHPNYIRTMLIESGYGGSGGVEDIVSVIESDMDHISGELMGYTTRHLFENGALDVVWIPVFMKKGRPGYRISVISKPDVAQPLANLLIKTTRTLGVRIENKKRVIASRDSTDITFAGTDCSEKHCFIGDYSFSKLEFDDLERIARQSGIPIMNIIENYICSKKNDP